MARSWGSSALKLTCLMTRSSWQVLKRVFPRIFEEYEVLSNDDYPSCLLDVLKYIAPRGRPDPTVVLLSPGMYNSAYFEHSWAKPAGSGLPRPMTSPWTSIS